MGFFKAKSSTFDPMSMYTPQQQASVNALASLASTGSGGGITLGQQYGGDLGYYQQTPGELQALQGLQGLVGGGDITGARDVYSRMASNKFNPDDPSSGYAAYSRALAKAGAESADVLNREAAMTGSRFGTGIQNQKADLASDLANQRGMFLADLYNQSESRALQGASGLQNLVDTQQNLYRQLSQQAEIERLLKDKQAKDQYLEFDRARNEEMKRLDLMNQQWQNPMGKITTQSPSLFSQLAAPLGAAAGFAIGGPAGAAIGGQLGGAVGGMTTGMNPNGDPRARQQQASSGGWGGVDFGGLFSGISSMFSQSPNLSSQTKAFGGGTAPYSMPLSKYAKYGNNPPGMSFGRLL